MGTTLLNSTRNIALACALSALAGYVDGIGSIHLELAAIWFAAGLALLLSAILAVTIHL